MILNSEKNKVEKQKCQDKIVYRTYSEANFEIKIRMKNRELRVYRCPFCDNFHLTKKGNKKIGKKRKKVKKMNCIKKSIEKEV